jgi:FlaA1/EpsC-like NDP-sugar epimerase
MRQKMSRRLIIQVVDGLFWLLALGLAVWLRQDFKIESVLALGLLSAVALIAGVYLVSQYFAGRFGYWLEIGSLDEVIRSQVAALSVVSVFSVINLLLDSPFVPRSVPMIGFFIFSTLLVIARGSFRIWVRRALMPQKGFRTVIVGAGSAGISVLRLLLSSPSSHYLPVAIVDDDPRVRGSRFEGITVQGVVEDLAEVAGASEAEKVIFAVPSANSDLLARVMDQANRIGVEVLTLPRSDELFGVVGLSDLRRVSPQDLLNREDVRVPMEEVSSWLGRKRVLITGAGGSIGGEISRQISLLEPGALVFLDHDESALHATQLSLDGRGLLDSDVLALADIRDKERVRELFSSIRPDVVFHAAALKHLTLLERNPVEAWKTNVLGTINVLEAAVESGVEMVINISTDKAADPTSILGMSKLVGERLAAGFGNDGSLKVVSVRFGNVLGSRGSVLTAFAEQAKTAKQIVVTDPDVTRFFMTVEEAVRLTLFAGVVGSDGETLILDMGEPVKILNVARRFAETTVPPLPIIFSGLRSGEKLHEVLISRDEMIVKTSIGKIMHVRVAPLDGSRLCNLGPLEPDLVRQKLNELCFANSVMK